MKATTLILQHFGKAFTMSESNMLSFEEVNKISSKHGYIVHPNACTLNVVNFLHEQNIDYNSTFYKNWSDVTSKTRLELYFDQIKHYFSTYGTNFSGEMFLPEGTLEIPNFELYKFIYPITRQELINKIVGVFSSGIALKQSTIEDYISILKYLAYNIDINLVKNKEAKLILYKQLGIVPKNVDEFVRFLIYTATNNTLLISNGETIRAIHNSNIKIGKYVEQFGYKKLAESFLRHKDILLAFKKIRDNKSVLNKLNKLAKVYHKPLQENWFDKILSDSEYYPELIKNIDIINNFKKINLMQTIKIRLRELDNRFYIVRNQKMFVKNSTLKINKFYLSDVYNILEKSLIESLSKKKCTVKMSENIHLTLPTTEKSFIGEFPVGTSFDYSKNDNIFGIHWKGVDGVRDLDLSLISVDGKKYGWNSHYTNVDNTIIFSGDMTSANPEATELFYAKKGFKPSLVNVNLYSGNINSKYTMFLATEKVDKLTRNYMVNPNNIIFRAECEMDSYQKIIGVLTDTKFILGQFRTGKGRVAYNDITSLYTNYTLDTLNCYIDMKSILERSGFNIVTDNQSDVDIDLSNPTKDVLINLFS